MAGKACIWFIPLHLSFAFLYPVQRFLQCQGKNAVCVGVATVVLCFHAATNWLFVAKLQPGRASTYFLLLLGYEHQPLFTVTQESTPPPSEL